MSLHVFAALYALAGVGAAVARLVWRGRPDNRAVDAALLVALWPLYGPFLVLSADPRTLAAEDAFLGALRRARATPLGALLPDAETAQALAARLRLAAAKVTEIDAILARPEFREDAARARLGELTERGASETARSTAAMRLDNIRRLGTLRQRFAAELDDIGELLLQLSTHIEVVRLTGASMAEPAQPSAGLVRELMCRVEALGQVIDDEPYLIEPREPRPAPQARAQA